VRVQWVVAGLVGLINIMLMRPLARYRLWWTLLRRTNEVGYPHRISGAWLIGYLIYLGVAAATGVGSYIVANMAGWGPGQQPLAHAAAAGAAGALVLRADVSHPVGKARDHAKNLATPLVTWLGAFFDRTTKEKLEGWASKLSDNDLREAAGLLSSDVGKAGSTITREMLRSKADELKSDEKRLFARGSLIGMIAEGYLQTNRTPREFRNR
jgi:hypothetical protein